MTQVHERFVVHCPYTLARDYLRESLTTAIDTHSAGTLLLSAPLAFVPGALEKNVLVTYRPAVDPMRFDEPWGVHWTPEGGGPYPDFDGELTVRADESYRGAVLELRGEYVPPLGMFGDVFDLILGSRIAAATARALLRDIARDMERRYYEEECAKKQSRPAV